MKRVLCMLLIASCSRSLPPDPQVLLYVDTDAIVAGSADPLVLSPQVDRVRFDLVVGSTPVPGGARVFDITDETLRSQRLSIGVLPQGTVLPQVRVRFYRADRAATEDPPVGATLEVLVDLAQVPLGDEVTEAFTFVSADSFGKPIAAPGERRIFA